MAEEKTRYTDEELEEFRQIIEEKLEIAQRDYEELKNSFSNSAGNGVDDTSPTYKSLGIVWNLQLEKRLAAWLLDS